MNSVLLISSAPIGINNLSKVYRSFGSAYLQENERLVVEGEWGYFILQYDPNVENIMGLTEIHQIKQLIPTPFYYQLEFSSADAAEVAILNFPLGFKVMIDNDFGVIWTLEEAQRRFKARIEWLTVRGRNGFEGYSDPAEELDQK